MKDKNGEEIRLYDLVEWKTHGWDSIKRRGWVLDIVPANGEIKENIKMFIKNRVIVEVERPRGPSVLYGPRPTSVEVIKTA